MRKEGCTEGKMGMDTKEIVVHVEKIIQDETHVVVLCQNYAAFVACMPP